MDIFKAISNGSQNVIQSKKYIFLSYGMNLLLALILGLVIYSILSESIGHSLAGENLRNAFDERWYPSFKAQSQGLATTFNPSVVGIGAVFNGLETQLKGGHLQEYSAVAFLGFFYLILWTFLSAGFISIYGKKKEQSTFVQQGAKYFLRFLTLAILAGIVYFLLFYLIMDWLNNLVNTLTRETIDERIHFSFVVAKYIVVWLLILTVNLVFDYSKIITVVNDRKNVFTVPLTAVRLVLSNFGKTYGLYLIISIMWVVLMLIYWLVSPGTGQSSWLMIFIAFVVGQIYLLMRISTRCLFYAGQTELYKSMSKEN